jgi:hypothetical protein
MPGMPGMPGIAKSLREDQGKIISGLFVVHAHKNCLVVLCMFYCTIVKM